MSYILVRSLSRTTGSTSSSNFSISLNPPIRLERKKRLKLEYLQMYSTIYNIDATNNNLDFFENATNKSIIAITTGIYDATSLGTSLQTALNNASGGFNTYTVSFNTQTKKYTLSAGNAFILKFANALTSLWKIMGYSTSGGITSVDSVSGTTTSSPFVVNFSLPLSVYIQIPTFQSNYITTSQDRFTYYVPLTVSSGGIVEYKSKDYWDQYINVDPYTTSLNKLEVLLTGANNSAMNLQNSEWEMILEMCD